MSAVLTNGLFQLNLDCDKYINNINAICEAMCFLMDPDLGKKTCYVLFSQRSMLGVFNSSRLTRSVHHIQVMEEVGGGTNI